MVERRLGSFLCLSRSGMMLSALAATATAAEFRPDRAAGAPARGSGANLIFNTGFEQTTVDDPANRAPRLSGHDDSYPEKSDWQADFVGHPRIDHAYIQYVGKERSDVSKQLMTVIDDPTGAGRGQVLHFFNRETKPGGSTYTRTQARVNFNRVIPWTEFFQRWKMYIGDEVAAYGAAELSVQLFTEIRTVDQEVSDQRIGFRVNLNLVKTGDGLAWYLFGQTISTAPGPRYTTLWRQANRAIPVPIGEWMTLEMAYRNGRGSLEDGLFQLAMIDRNGREFSIFDVRNQWMDHPDKTENFMLNWYKPFVIYCHDRVLAEIRKQGPGAGIRTYYDDFELWTSRPPDAVLLSVPDGVGGR